ncbi:2103_t:CDS:1, partial [Racocetra persica]
KLNINDVLLLMKTDNRIGIRKFFDNMLSGMDSSYASLRNSNSEKILQLLVTANDFQYRKTVNNLLTNIETILGNLNEREIFQLLMMAKVLKHNIITDRLFLSEGFTKLILDNLNCTEILNLLIIADQMQLQKFFNHMLNFIDQKLEEYMNLDAFSVIRIIFNNAAFKSLHDPCLHLICINPRSLFEHRKFTQLDKSILMLVLQRDDLGTLKEINIWNYLVQWGIAQNSIILRNNFKEWRKEDYDILEKTIHDCIPLIRWYQMSMLDISENLNFLQNIISIEPILHYLHGNTTPSNRTTTLPPRYTPPNHMFHVRLQHFDIIASWIDKKDLNNSSNNNEQITPNESLYYNSDNNPYNFSLLYCAKRDGFNSKEFHRLCDDKGPTVTIIKIMDLGIFGGFNALSWKHPESVKTDNTNYSISDDNFLFYFDNKNDFNISNLSRVRKNCLVDKCYSLHGPCFGWNKKYKFSNDDSHDIYIDNDYLYICQRFIHNSHPNFSIFEKLQSKYKYEIEDYEVWQIVKKSDKLSQ